MSLLDDLVSFWAMDEASGTRNDSHSTNHLTDNNTVGSATGLVYGTAADFERDNSEFLSHVDNAELQVGDIDFTIGAWVKPEELAGVDLTIAGVGAATGHAWELLSRLGGLWRFRTASADGSANNTFVSDSGSGPVAGEWDLVFGWHDAVNNVIGIATSRNSFNVFTTSYANGVWNSGEDFVVGFVQSNGDPFDGLIGPVMFWKRILTDDERAQLYNGGAGLTYAALAGGIGAGVLALAGFSPRLDYAINMPDEL